MFATLVTATLLCAFAAVQGVRAQDQGFTIATISLQQCAPAHVVWTGGQGPFDLAIVSADDPCNTILAELGNSIQGQSFDMRTVSIAAGTNAMFSLIDANGDETWSGAMVVADGAHGCLANGPNSKIPTNTPSPAPAVLTPSIIGYATQSTTSPVGGATAIGAANSGLLPSGATSSASLLPTAFTIFGSLAAVVVSLYAF